MESPGVDRRVGERRRDDGTNSEAGGNVLRPITSPVALEHARRLLDLGVDGIEQRPDGRLWAVGVDRRQSNRRGGLKPPPHERERLGQSTGGILDKCCRGLAACVPTRLRRGFLLKRRGVGAALMGRELGPRLASVPPPGWVPAGRPSAAVHEPESEFPPSPLRGERVAVAGARRIVVALAVVLCVLAALFAILLV